MEPFRIRIGNIRYKDGPTLRVIPSEKEAVSRTLRTELSGSVTEFFERAPVAGFALVVWFVDGESATTSHNAHTSPYAANMMPALVEECVRRNRTQTQIDRALGHGDTSA